MSSWNPFSPNRLSPIRVNLLITICYVLVTACTPPTPPPSPTPWPSDTPPPVDAGPTSAAAKTPEPSTPAASTATPEPTTPAENVTITVWTNLSEAQTALLAQDVEAFQAEFPQYKVELKQYSSPEDFMTPLTAGQLEFDVVLASPVLLGHLWSAEQLAPMSDFFPASFLDGFASVTLAGATGDKALWGLPDTAGFHLLLFYNRNLVDTPPATTTALFDMAQALTENSRWGLGLNSYDPLWVAPWLLPYGSWLTDNAGTPTLNTPAMADALTLYLSWQGRLAGIAPVETYDEMRAKFVAGNIAMMIDGEWAIGELAGVNKVNWGVAPLPGVGTANDNQPAVPLVLARYWAISQRASGERAQAAAAFLEFITRPERQLTWLTQFGVLPTQRKALDDPIIINDPIWRVSAAQMRAGRAVPLGVNANTLLDAMRRPLQGVIDGELTPQEAAELMQANVGER